MSITSSVIPLGIGYIGTWIYINHQHSKKQEKDIQSLERQRQMIKELEEEIVRLKREMRICGIKTSSDERSRQENHSK